MKTESLNFYHMGLAPKMLKTLDRLKFVTPTPIQHKTIPLILEGNDIVGIAQTGTGKTLSFGVPTIQLIANANSRALVLVPTRELAIQVHDALKPILQAFGLKGTVLIGGAPIHRQKQSLRSNPALVIATPGRLIDLTEQKALNLKSFNFLILDEADRMFDMGFAPQVEKIIRGISSKRQTLLFSATMPKAIMRLVNRYMKLPTHIEIAPSGTSAEGITQEMFVVKEDAKADLLLLLLQEYKGSVLVFTRTRIGAKRLTRKIYAARHKVAEIHSDRTMAQRKISMEGFRSGRYRILVATDIAARGIDVSMIELVVNYDLPEDSENYVHRIGRTGRAGLQGHAISFVRPDQGSDVTSIERLINKTIPISKHPQLPSSGLSRQQKSSAGKSRKRGNFSRFKSRSHSKSSGSKKRSNRPKKRFKKNR